MRLTVDILRRAPQFTNTLLQREIDLRGFCLSSLDETALVLLENEFDVINLTSNSLTSLEYFPILSGSTQRTAKMDRIVTLVVHRNQLQKVSVTSCVLALPFLQHFLADRNNFKSVKDLCFLKYWKELQVVSLEMNPVWERNPENFDEGKLRAFLAFLCPHLKLINYQRVTVADRTLAETCTKEFKALLQMSEGSTGIVGNAGDGRKIRKRGRENRAVAAAGGTSRPVTMPPTSSVDGSQSVEPLPAAADDNDDLQARLEQIEERILASETGDEIEALEREMNELTAEMERRRKRKKINA